LKDGQIAGLVKATAERLRHGGVTNARREAEWIVQEVIGRDRWLSGVCRRTPLSADETARVTELARERAGGRPLQYVLGTVEFHGRTFSVGPGVLIPRPETEQLVELALGLYPGHGEVCDLCTGSGVIAISLALTLPGPPHVLATDISEPALAYARRNAAALGAANLTLVQGDLFGPLPAPRRFSLITANPPYVSAGEYDALPCEVRNHEPATALLAGSEGLDIIRRIADGAPRFLSPDGWLLLEIGETQGAAVRELLDARGYAEVAVRPDYAGRDRFALARSRGALRRLPHGAADGRPAGSRLRCGGGKRWMEAAGGVVRPVGEARGAAGAGGGAF